ncbi:unnamed protein product [Phytomonas sp. Hart1]|nr:unnamed protein product [Phytomonas sp. Hart1]|eukprot:CCW71763.1 unnamed protein product [Phytomonas sp. isolate Hart1]
MTCRGCPNSSGHPSRHGRLSAVDGPVVRNFREAGAIILGVTNTSELCMWYESSNYVYGITCNPYDTRCIVGGSSGGEGTAAGAAFSVFGIGSDIGGSIRMPCFFNGVYGHKSSPHYISNSGQHPGARSSANHYMSTGVITRFPEDLIPLNQIAARGGFGKDPAIFPPAQPLEKVVDFKSFRRRLRVFAVEEFGAPWPVRVSESQKEAVRVAAEALCTHLNAHVTYVNVIDRQRCTAGEVPPEFAPFPRILEMWFDALSFDPEENKFRKLMAEGHGNEDVNWFAELLRWMFGRSRHTLPALVLCVMEEIGDWLAFWRNPHKPTSCKTFESFKTGLETLLGEDGILLTPTFPTAAPRHHAPNWNPLQFQYTAAFNVLQFPATTCPIWLGAEMKDAARSLSYFEARAAGLPRDFHLPKGVQVVGATHQDELCISVAIALKEILGGYRYPGWAHLKGT